VRYKSEAIKHILIKYNNQHHDSSETHQRYPVHNPNLCLSSKSPHTASRCKKTVPTEEPRTLVATPPTPARDPFQKFISSITSDSISSVTRLHVKLIPNSFQAPSTTPPTTLPPTLIDLPSSFHSAAAPSALAPARAMASLTSSLNSADTLETLLVPCM